MVLMFVIWCAAATVTKCWPQMYLFIIFVYNLDSNRIGLVGHCTHEVLQVGQTLANK